MKLTEKQRHALKSIKGSPHKSGGFWRDLGISPVTLAQLEEKGLIGAPFSVFKGQTTITRRSWTLTEAGTRIDDI